MMPLLRVHCLKMGEWLLFFSLGFFLHSRIF